MIVDDGKYYLYRHVRLDTNQPFYIGIGTKPKAYQNYNPEYNRAFSHTRSGFWKKIANKTPYKVEILLESDDRKFLEDKEIEFIALYGRRNLKLGTLVNLSNGGEGLHGYVPSLETRRKASEAKKGVPKSEKTKQKLREANLGKKLSIETINKIRVSRNLKPKYVFTWDLYDLENNLIFENKTDEFLSAFLNLKQKCISARYLNKSVIANKYGVVLHGSPFNKEDYLPKYSKQEKLYKKCLVYNDNFQMEFKSMKEVSDYFNTSYSSVKQCIRKDYWYLKIYKIKLI